MSAGISGLVTTRRVVARQPRPLAALVLGLTVACQPRPLATLVLGLAVARYHRSVYLRVLRLCLGLQWLLIQSHAHCLPAHLLQDHHQAQPHYLGCAEHGCFLSCLREASPTTLNGFQFETEKEPVQSDLRHLCINYRMDNIILINLLKYSTKN